MDVQELDTWRPSVDVIAMMMLGALVGSGEGLEYFDDYDVDNCVDFSYELADALVHKRETRYCEGKD